MNKTLTRKKKSPSKSTKEQPRLYSKQESPPLHIYFLVSGLILIGLTVGTVLYMRSYFEMHTILLIIGGIAILIGAMFAVMRIRIDKDPIVLDLDDLDLAVRELAQNFALSRSQTNNAFLLTAIFMGIGLIVISVGAVRALSGITDDTNTLVIVAGAISEFISGGALLVYNKNFNRLKDISEKLYETWKIFAAYKLAKTLPEKEYGAATISLINALANSSKESVKK